jgi:hypothetical protein
MSSGNKKSDLLLSKSLAAAIASNFSASFVAGKLLGQLIAFSVNGLNRKAGGTNLRRLIFGNGWILGDT